MSDEISLSQALASLNDADLVARGEGTTLEQFRTYKRTAPDGEEQLAKRARTEQLTVLDEKMEAMQLLLLEKMEAIAAAQQGQMTTLKLFMAGVVRQGLEGFFPSKAGFFQNLRGFFQGTKRRCRMPSRDYPAAQQATDRDMILQKTLLSFALEQMPSLTPAVYDAVKNAFAKRAKALRVFLAVERPLLWTNVANGGRQYVYLTSELHILQLAWTGTHFGWSAPRAASCETMAQTKLRSLLASNAPLGEWTSSTCDLEYPLGLNDDDLD